jgi:hypothetical protein
MMGLPSLSVGELVEGQQLIDDLLVAAVADALDGAGAEVAGEDDRLQLLEGAADGEGLLEDVDAVGVLLDHALDAVEVAVDVAEAFEAVVAY